MKKLAFLVALSIATLSYSKSIDAKQNNNDTYRLPASVKAALDVVIVKASKVIEVAK